LGKLKSFGKDIGLNWRAFKLVIFFQDKDGNLMIEGEGLSEMNFCLKDISIEYWNDLSINDARFMMKMQAKYLQAISNRQYIFSFHRQ
jgi:hypothetical protein